MHIGDKIKKTYQGPQRRGGVERSKARREAISDWSLDWRRSVSDMTASVYFSSCSMYTSMCRMATLSPRLDIQLYGSSQVESWNVKLCGFRGGLGGFGGAGAVGTLKWAHRKRRRRPRRLRRSGVKRWRMVGWLGFRVCNWEMARPVRV